MLLPAIFWLQPGIIECGRCDIPVGFDDIRGGFRDKLIGDLGHQADVQEPHGVSMQHMTMTCDVPHGHIVCVV